MSLRYGWGGSHSTYQYQSTKQEVESRSHYTSFGGQVEVPKSGRAMCKKCKSNIGEGGVRVRYEEEPNSDNWHWIKEVYHLNCYKPKYGKGRIEDENSIDGFSTLPDDKKDVVRTWLKNWNAKADAYLAQVNTTVELTDEETVMGVTVARPPNGIMQRSLMSIYEFLSAREVSRVVAHVCKQWYYVAWQSETWKLFFKRDFPDQKAEDSKDTKWRVQYIGLGIKMCFGCKKFSPQAEECTILNKTICDECRSYARVPMISKSSAAKVYHVSEKDLKKYKIKSRKMPNPKFQWGAPMSLYYEHQVKEVAAKKEIEAAKPRKTAADKKNEKTRKTELTRALSAKNVDVKAVDWTSGILLDYIEGRNTAMTVVVKTVVDNPKTPKINDDKSSSDEEDADVKGDDEKKAKKSGSVAVRKAPADEEDDDDEDEASADDKPTKSGRGTKRKSSALASTKAKAKSKSGAKSGAKKVTAKSGAKAKAKSKAKAKTKSGAKAKKAASEKEESEEEDDDDEEEEEEADEKPKRATRGRAGAKKKAVSKKEAVKSSDDEDEEPAKKKRAPAKKRMRK